MKNLRTKAQSTGFAFIIGLITLVVIGVFFIILNQAAQNDIVPVANALIESSPYVNDTTDQLERIETFNSYWLMLPLFFFLVIAFFIIVKSLSN